MNHFSGETRRRHERHRMDFPVEIAYEAGGGLVHRLKGKSVDVSESGMRVKLNERIPDQAYVSVRARTQNIHGSGSVRHCKPLGLGYAIGLEFSGGLIWKPPAVDAVNGNSAISKN